MNTHSNVVLKLGGSLMNCGPALIQRIEAKARQDGQFVLIVPGGGVFADNIRRFHKTSDVTDDAVHWMAVLAVEQYAYYLADRSGVPLTDTLDPQEPGVNILLPYTLLRSDDTGLDHSWDVTSDTISAWVARRTGDRLIKATDVDGILIDGKLVPWIYAGDLADGKETCVDKGLPPFLVKHNMDCMVVNGTYPERVFAALEGESTAGTLIAGKNKL
jgi:aspartokinase-like uncharacterized kinase